MRILYGIYRQKTIFFDRPQRINLPLQTNGKMVG